MRARQREASSAAARGIPRGGRGRMMAVVQDVYGESGVLRLEEVDRPVVGAGQVLLRVHAAGVDRGAWHLMTGLPYPVRLAGFGLRVPKDRVRGREVAGTVAAVGPGVSTLAVGDVVFGVAEGGFAEYASAAADLLVPVPPGITAVQAAALPMSGLTALQAVRDHGRVQPGQHVLVIGASGGVGTFAVQIAKSHGARVTGVCHTSKTDLVRALGADHVIDYTREDITDGSRRYDVILDIGGGRPLRQLRRGLTPRGRLVIVGQETGGRLLGGFDRLLRAVVLSPFVGQHLGGFVSPENGADLRALAGLVSSGAVIPAVDRTFPLAQAPAAVQYLRDGRARGKVVITVGAVA